jgi:hypothetical protein
MNLRQRCQAVFQAGYKVGQQTFRSLAAATKLSKSSVHRLYHRLQRRNQYPESQLWETEAGQQWLRLLVFAAVFVFALEGGIGCERLSEFFHLLRLERHIGVSPSALRRLRTRMEQKILEYQQKQQTQLKDASEVEICAAADEKFFDQVVLVMLDLPSGYILVEELTENRHYKTWQLSAQKVLQDLGLKVKYLVSDRAKAIVKLALSDLGCPSIADLFHALFELSKSLGWELNYLTTRIEKRLEAVRSNSQSSPELIKQLETEQSLLQSSNQTYQRCSQRISTSLHPFAIADSSPQSTLQVQTLLKQEIHQLRTLKQTHRLKDQRDSINKLARQVQELADVVDIWWSWVNDYLGLHLIESPRCDWIKKQLLPAVYWQQQVRRTKTGTLNRTYQLAYQQAWDALMHHPATATLSQTNLQQWLNWASWMVSKFQRCSSPVEGRNGYLSQVYHNRRGLSSRRLKVMTVIHNFYLQRRDGTTAAERLLGKKFPNLFESVVSQMGELPTPRKSRKLPLDTTVSFPAVPS